MRESEIYRTFERDDDRLLDALAKGNREAIAYLFDAKAKSLCFYCREILRDEAMAEDVVQEVFVRLWETPRRFPSRLAAHAFLYRVGRNLALDMLKHRLVQRRHEPAIARELSCDFLDEKLIEEELIGELHRAIGQLPAECARVFRLSLAGAGNQEIADRLSISIHTVKTQKQRAMAALRERLGRDPHE